MGEDRRAKISETQSMARSFEEKEEGGFFDNQKEEEAEGFLTQTGL